MDDDEDGSSYFMEVYDQIRSVDVVLRGSDHPKQLEIQPKKIIAKKCDGTRDVYPLVVSVEPSSYTSIQKHLNEGVGIRLQMKEENQEPSTGFLSTTVKRVGNELSRMERGACQCGCKTCGLTLFVDNVKFSRILPLPSQTWRDLFNNWSCCSSSHGEGKTSTPAYVSQPNFKPREGDCLVDDFNIMVHCKAVERKNILLRKIERKVADKGQLNSQSVKCARCRAIVGELLTQDNKTIDAFKLNKNNIEVLSLRKHLSETVVRPIFFSEFFLERLLAQQLSNAVHTHSTHLFVVQDTDKNVYLLLRILNTKSRLYVNNGKAANEASEASKELLSKTIKNCEDGDSVKHCRPGDKSARHQVGSGDCKGVRKPTMAEHNGPGENPNASESEAIRRDGPPRMHGSKVAEVIEKLFSFSTHLISIGRTCSDIRNADESGCERIVKVMYVNTYEEKSLSKLSLKWLNDERTLTLSYPKHICIQILLVLVSSTLTMPVAHRVVDDFVVGFLRLD